MSLLPKLEALIYAAEEPVTLDQMAALLKDDLLALKAAAANAAAAAADSSPADAPGQPAENTSAAREKEKDVKKAHEKSERAELRALLRPLLDELVAEYSRESHGIEIRQVAGGYRMSTKPEHHDVVRAFSKSLKPPIRLSLPALETLAVIAYKQPITVPEINEIRGVDASGVIGTLLERKLISTAGRKAVVGRPMLYKTSKDFLMRFGLRDLNELPSLEEFEKLAAGELQEDLQPVADSAIADATGVPDENRGDGGVEQMAEDRAETPQNVTEPTVSSDPGHTQTDEQIADEIASESTGG
jgi:segregation and condensation protein B